MLRECRDPGMHHGTCVTHMPWCLSGSLTRGGGENRHSRRMRNPQFYVSGKRPMAVAWHACQLSPASSQPVSIADKTPNFNISWSLEVARFVFRTVRLLWYMTGTSAALLCYWPSVRGSICHWRIPLTKASGAELWSFLWSEQMVMQTIDSPVI